MPTYEYVCKQCGHLFEIVQSMRDDALTECPQCGGELRKVFAPPAISFKGSGFYATDHREKAKKNASDTSDKSDKKEAPASDKKTETKKENAGTGGGGNSGGATGGGGGASGASSSDTKKS